MKNIFSADGLNQVHIWEQAVVHLLNLDGWNLTHTGGGTTSWDAQGYTPKNKEVVIEMKFRNKHYQEKMIQLDKFNKLIATNKTALYFVNDPKGNYMFWLNNLKDLKPINFYLPDTTLWNSNKLKKPCYLLDESLASVINLTDFKK
mgnify:FL=1